MGKCEDSDDDDDDDSRVGMSGGKLFTGGLWIQQNDQNAAT